MQTISIPTEPITIARRQNFIPFFGRIVLLRRCMTFSDGALIFVSKSVTSFGNILQDCSVVFYRRATDYNTPKSHPELENDRLVFFLEFQCMR